MLNRTFNPLCVFLLLLCTTSGHATNKPWRAANTEDMTGLWRQAGSVTIDESLNVKDSWYSAKQFFLFTEDGRMKHVLIDPDSEPTRLTPNAAQMNMIEIMPAQQTITWRSPGIAFLKHPERPRQRMDIGLYTQDADSGPGGGDVTPRRGDLVIVYYGYRDINKALYYRLLRRIVD